MNNLKIEGMKALEQFGLEEQYMIKLRRGKEISQRNASDIKRHRAKLKWFTHIDAVRNQLCQFAAKDDIYKTFILHQPVLCTHELISSIQ